MKRLLAIYILLILLIGCKKNPIEWDTSLNLPLFQTELSFTNILPDSMISVDENRLLSLVIDKKLFSLSTNSITTFPDSIFQLDLEIPNTALLAPNALFFYKNELQTLQLSPVELTQIALYKGFLTFEVINPFDQPIEIEYQIPAAKLNGNPLRKKVTIPKGNAHSNNYTARINLDAYRLDLRGPQLNSFNSYQNILSVRVSPQATDSARAIGNQLFLKIHFEDIDLAYIKGYFGKQRQNYGPKTEEITFFDRITEGTLDLEKSRAFLTIQNGIGADLQFQLQELSATNTKNNSEIPFQSSLINSTINITRASETNLPHNPVIPSQTEIDITNSNILELLTAFPDKISYCASLEVNPMGNISSGNDFVYRLHDFNTRLYLEIPLSFTAANLTLRDELPYSVGEDLANINSLNLNLIVENGFPFSARIKLEIIDRLGNSVCTLIENDKLISPAQLIEEGVTAATRSIIPIKLTKQETNLLKNNSKMRIFVTLNTDNSNYTKIYESYKMALKLSGIVDYHAVIE